MTLRDNLRAIPGLRRIVRAARNITPVFYPATGEALKASDLYSQPWYYSMELLPGVITQGQYEAGFPMLPRRILRNCEVGEMECLDMGSMEGLVPALLAKRGAKRVLATDAVDHCARKLAAVKHYHDVEFDYRSVGLMYALDKKIGGSFDLINCSGLLYHVVSPFMVLAGIRPLVKRNGIVIVSTNVVHANEYLMEFNNAGRLQDELNTFWYPSIPLIDYLLRYLRLAPIDCLYLPHENVRSRIRYRTDKQTGYLSIACRAVDEPLAAGTDPWMTRSARESWEYLGLVDWRRAGKNPVSKIGYEGNSTRIDLWEAVNSKPPLGMTANLADAHCLRLEDQS